MGKKKAKCEICQKTFLSAYRFKIHNQIHEQSEVTTNKQLQKSPVKASAQKLRSSPVKVPALKPRLSPVKVSTLKPRMSPVKVSALKPRSSMEKNPFKCKRCSKSFPSKYSLGMHQKLQCHQHVLKCSKCPKTFVYQSALDNHMSTKHGMLPSDSETLFKSKTSPEKKSALVEHVEIHTKKSEPGNKLVLNLHINLEELSDIIERLYKCSVCGDLFSSEVLLKTHMIEHAEASAQSSVAVKKELFGCHLCDGRFTSKAAFSSHMKLHQAKELHVCHVCSEVFQDEDSLIEHTRGHNNDILFQEQNENETSTLVDKKPFYPSVQQKLYPCKICTVIFPSEEALSSHFEKHKHEEMIMEEDVESDVDDPTEQYVFRCEFCEKLFPTSRALSLHVQTHPGVIKLYQCELCSKKFASENDYKEHRKTHLAKVSNIASKTVTKPATTNNLKTVRTVPRFVGVTKSKIVHKKAAITYQCDACDETLPDEASLGYHRTQNHSDDKPFKCHVCRNVFPQSRFLKCHLRMVHKL